MKISAEEVRHVADLARLDMPEDRLELFTSQMNNILVYMDKLNELDTTGVQPTTHVVDMQNAFREDEVRESLDMDKALANAPQQDRDSFVVPRVI